jgi:hypothetical protein
VLNEWYTIAAVFIAYPNQNWVTLASDKDVLLTLNSDTILGKDRDGIIICEAPDTNEGGRKVIEGVGLCCTRRNVVEG